MNFLPRSAHATDPRGRSADDPTDHSKFFRRFRPRPSTKKNSGTPRVRFYPIFSLLRRLAPPKTSKKRKIKISKILSPGRMIFAIFARFLKSFMRFDVKISFLSVFCFRCTYYKPHATENWRKWVQHCLCAPP